MWKGGVSIKVSILGFQHGSRKNKTCDSKTSIFEHEERTFTSTFPSAFPLLPPWREMDIKDTGKKAVLVHVPFHSTYGRKGDKVVLKVPVQETTWHSISEPSALSTSRTENLHWHQFYFTFEILLQLGVFTVFPEISSLKFNHICSAWTVWKNKAFSNLMISVLRWKISCLP